MTITTEQDSGDKSFNESEVEVIDEPVSPILPEIQVPTHEEEEEEILKLRAKLYRFDRSDTNEPEWKERGVGQLKMLKHSENKTVRIVMRRDKTLKVCANHFVTPLMDLKPKTGHDRVFLYSSLADFTFEHMQKECFAVRFSTVNDAKQFEKAFLEAQEYVKKECKLYNGEADKELDDDDDEEDNESASDADADNDGDEENVSEKPTEECSAVVSESVQSVADSLKELSVEKSDK